MEVQNGPGWRSDLVRLGTQSNQPVENDNYNIKQWFPTYFYAGTDFGLDVTALDPHNFRGLMLAAETGSERVKQL